MECGFYFEHEGLEYNCWEWGFCPHQPITVYDVWAVQAISAAGPDLWHYIGRYDTRHDARIAALGTNADWIDFIEPVQYCRWPASRA